MKMDGGRESAEGGGARRAGSREGAEFASIR